MVGKRQRGFPRHFLRPMPVGEYDQEQTTWLEMRCVFQNPLIPSEAHQDSSSVASSEPQKVLLVCVKTDRNIRLAQLPIVLHHRLF